ncbi:MAG: hypothetical protein LC104_08290 [Bacteroidales bacterium]|nr:hypothetical protein [Bacteroidales bacterium]
MITTARFLTASLIMVICGLGCSNADSGRQSIEGTVTFAGQPVAEGTIYFEPDVKAGNDGPQGVADIHDGKFETRPEFGCWTGPHIVRVMIPPGPMDDPGDAKPKRGQAGEYLTKIDIPAGTKTLRFELPFPK